MNPDRSKGIGCNTSIYNSTSTNECLQDESGSSRTGVNSADGHNGDNTYGGAPSIPDEDAFVQPIKPDKGTNWTWNPETDGMVYR